MNEDWTEKQWADYGRRIMEAPRARHFPGLGWTVVVLPLDLYESRFVASFGFSQMHGFKREEVQELRARRLNLDGEERTWWVLAISCEGMERRKREIEEAMGEPLEEGRLPLVTVLQVPSPHMLADD